MQIVQWLLLTFACYRLQRVITTDSWLPFWKWRAYLAKKALPAAKNGRHSVWTELAELFSCPHCMGVWITALTYLIAIHYLNIPHPILQSIATMGGISVLAEQENDDGSIQG